MISQPSHKSHLHFLILSGIFLLFLVASIFTSYYFLVAVPFLFLFFYWGWQKWQVIFSLLVFTLPWSVEYMVDSSLGTDLPDEPLMLFTASLFIAYSFFKPADFQPFLRHPLISILLWYMGWILITVIFSTDAILSLKFFLAKCWYLLAFAFAPLLILKNKTSIARAAHVFIISMLMVTILSLYRHAGLGFRFAGINDAVYPFFRNHVNYSSMLVCAFPVLVAIYQVNKKYRVVTVAAIGIVIMAIFFSYARGAWLALLAGIVSYWFIKRGKAVSLFLFGIFLVIASVFWISSQDRYLQYTHDYKTTIFHKDFQEHLVATYKLKDVSTAERFYRWIAGVRMIKDNWLTGFGPNTFYYNYKPYAIPAFKTWVSENKEHSTVHNYFLLVLIEQGVPGLLFFLVITACMLFYSQKIYKRTDDKFYKSAAMACGVLTIMITVVNFLSDLIETDKVGSLFFLTLATLVAIDLQTRTDNRLKEEE